MEPSDECLLDSDATHCGRKHGTTGTTGHEQSHDGDAGVETSVLLEILLLVDDALQKATSDSALGDTGLERLRCIDTEPRKIRRQPGNETAQSSDEDLETEAVCN